MSILVLNTPRPKGLLTHRIVARFGFHQQVFVVPKRSVVFVYFRTRIRGRRRVLARLSIPIKVIVAALVKRVEKIVVVSLHVFGIVPVIRTPSAILHGIPLGRSQRLLPAGLEVPSEVNLAALFGAVVQVARRMAIHVRLVVPIVEAALAAHGPVGVPVRVVRHGRPLGNAGLHRRAFAGSR